MIASLVLSALVSGSRAQSPIYDNNAGGVNGNTDAYANFAVDPNAPQQPAWPQQQQYAAPTPILASEFIQSGQLPTWNPNYVSNAQGYFVPVIVDIEDELPADLAQKLVDPAQLEQLQAVGGGVPVAATWDATFAPQN